MRFRNQRGQMAIFIALIFQVLFVFFAMAINVALVVHDKINLQNSVDLAAYYAATKQAEILNVMAHENYMIRQSWKLLTFRYRVPGTFGQDNHPVRYSSQNQDPPPPDTLVTYEGLDAPGVCVTHDRWAGQPQGSSMCRKANVHLPSFPKITAPFIAPMNPFNAIFASISNSLAAKAANNCEYLGAYNWWYAMAILQAYREDQKNRKIIIKALADNLGSDDPKDLDGESIREGAEKTFRKNLTYSNSQSVQDFQFINPLKGIKAEQWLADIKVLPTVGYQDTRSQGNLGSGCTGVPTGVDQEPHMLQSINLLKQPAPQGLGAEGLMTWLPAMNTEVQGEDQLTLGVEKNPWLMIYVGVSAETAPRPVFFPFGNAVRLVASGFAKPFGGTIGPWYGRLWPRGSEQSDASDLNLRIDPLLPPRLSQGQPTYDPRLRLPNHSRFPGDQLGYRSQLMLSSFKQINQMIPDYQWFMRTWLPMDPQSTNDILAFAEPGQLGQNQQEFYNFYRELEMAVIAPDLFDITYYSIEPEFHENYLPRLKAGAEKLGIPSNVPIRGDLGSNHLTKEYKSVKDHLLANKKHSRQEAYFWVKEKEHLLTSWAPADVLYQHGTFPESKFGKCQTNDDNFKEKIPGSCVSMGGRTGYSVKIVSKEYLLSEMQNLGGANTSGRILNPPQE